MSLLKQTGQIWKVYVFLALMASGGAITLFQGLLPRVIGKELTTYLAIGGMVLVTGTFCWAYSSITCPNCNLKLFWYALTKVGLGTWFPWLLNEEKCPGCGSHDGLAPPARKWGKPKKERNSPGKEAQ